ncbi:MAG: class I mannose-6-phosphate isomerase [Tsuneonella sp.]
MSHALPTRTVEKPWGRDTLPPPFTAPAGKRIGEIWFEPPPALDDLLVKYLFTSEKLSVQVHPSDAEAPAGSRGKEECWLILDAEPGAALGIGFDEPIAPEAMRAAALDGSIEHLMTWHEVRPGDFFYLPAGTVHAIGAGISLIEIQQNSDITYRLYDYGRPRELHLDAGVAVAQGEPYAERWARHVHERGEVRLVDGPHFRLDRLDGPPSAATRESFAGKPLLVIPVDAPVELGGESLAPGACGLARKIGEVTMPERGRALIAQPV